MIKYSISEELLISEDGTPIKTYGIEAKDFYIPDVFLEKKKIECFKEVLNTFEFPRHKVLELAMFLNDL